MGGFATATRLTADATEEIRTTTTGGGGSINVNIQNVAGSPPALNNALPVELSDGTNAFGTAGNPLNVAISGGAGVGTIGSAVPTTAGYQGLNVGGVMRGWTGVNPSGSIEAGQIDKASVGGVAIQAASNMATDGSGVNEIVRAISRKFNQIVQTATVSPNTTFNSAWVDTQQTGDTLISLICNSVATLSSNSLKVQVSDDQANIITLAQFSPSSGTPLQVVVRVPMRYWRFTFTVGASSTSTYISATGHSVPAVPSPLIISGTGGLVGGDGAIATITASSVGAENVNNFFPVNAAGAGALSGMAMYVSAGTQASGGGWYAMRSPSLIHTAQATAAGNTALWTPTSGKKFRLMKLIVGITQNATLAAGAVLTVTFQDATTGIPIAFDVFVPSTAGTTIGDGYSSSWIDLGSFGYLSSTANNVLNINLSAALTAGNVRVTCCGTEE